MMLHYEQMERWIEAIFGYDKDIVGCEIGVLDGRMEDTLLTAFPRLFMFGIDKMNRGYAHARHRLIWEESDVAWKDFNNPITPVRLDFVYIDGCHDYEQVKKDILNYTPFVKEDGIVAGHDYVPNTTNIGDGVTPAVDELFDKDKVHFGADLAWYIYKRDIKWL